MLVVGCAASHPVPDPTPVGPEPTPSQAKPVVEPVVDEGQDPAPPPPIVVARPEAEPYLAAEPTGHTPAKVTFKVLSNTKNRITDTDRWLTEHQMPEPRSRTADVAPDFQGVPLAFAVAVAGEPPVAVYEDHAAPGPSFVVAPDRFALDLTAFRGDDAGGLTTMSTRDVILEDGVLYVTHAHSTYAETSGGRNAFVTAIRVSDGAVLWRSAPLVSNTHNILLHEGVILTGYGFTAEPDFLYALDRATGRVVAKLPLKSGPEYLHLAADGSLHVRTYDRDYVISMD